MNLLVALTGLQKISGMKENRKSAHFVEKDRREKGFKDLRT
jgi:hypothetical protein